MQQVFERVRARRSLTQHAFFGDFFAELKNTFPFFTSRDVRNIQRAVDSRIMDFDLPAEWLTNPQVFHKQDYDHKKGMITELMRANLKGVSLAEVRLEEVLHYVDNMVRIAEGGKERRISDLMGELEVQREAQRRMLHGASH